MTTWPRPCGATQVAVIGGGVAGLTTAWYLRAAADPPAVTLVETSRQLGGKLRTREVGGVRVELGADSFLTHPPHAERLCQRLGLGDDLVAPATTQVQLWVRGRLRPLPEGFVLGTPTRLGPLLASGLLSPVGIARAALDLALPSRMDLEQASVGTFVRRRLGREVVEQLVDPLLGGVYAGDVDRLSVIAATPQLAEATRLRRSLLLGLRELTSTDERGARPTFRTVRGGLSRLVDSLQVDPQGGLDLRCQTTARRVLPVAGGYRVELVAPQGRGKLAPQGRGQVDADPLEVDGVVLAVPAFAAAKLLRDAAPAAASVLDTIPYASVAVVTLVYPPGTSTPAGSGLLVPSGEGRLVRAATWVSSKWPHVAPGGEVVVRVSVGRVVPEGRGKYGADAPLELDDAELLAGVRGDLADMAGIQATPKAAHVTRWERALPQYEVGHLDRVRRVEQELSRLPGVVVTGAAYRGVGIAACIRQAQETAEALLGLLSQGPGSADSGGTREPARGGWSGATGAPPPRTPRRQAHQR